MKRRWTWIVILISLCLGITACQKDAVSDGKAGETEALLSSADGEMTEDEAETVEKPTQEVLEETAEETKQEIAEETGKAATEEITQAAAESQDFTEAVESSTEEPTEESEEWQSIHRDQPLAAGNEIIQQFDMGCTVEVDLNGDGIKEKLTVMLVEHPGYSTKYPVLQVDDVYFDVDALRKITGYLEGLSDKYYLMDLDTEDGWIEIALFEYGPSSDPVTTFLRYSDGILVLTGKVGNGPPLNSDGTAGYTVPGDGTVNAKERYDVIQTSRITKRWRLADGFCVNARLEEEVPEYYEFCLYRTKEEWCTVIKEFPVYTEKNSETAEILYLPEGTRLEFTRYYPEGEWLQIIYGEAETVGWIRFEGQTLLPAGIDRWWDTQSYISGMSMAD